MIMKYDMFDNTKTFVDPHVLYTKEPGSLKAGHFHPGGDITFLFHLGL